MSQPTAPTYLSVERAMEFIGDANGVLALLNTLPVGVVLMDMVMPDMDGMETTRRLRAHPNPEVAKLPVLGLTANHNPQDHLQCLQAGMNGVITKPIDTEIIVDHVHNHLFNHLPACTRSI